MQVSPRVRMRRCGMQLGNSSRLSIAVLDLGSVDLPNVIQVHSFLCGRPSSDSPAVQRDPKVTLRGDADVERSVIGMRG